MFLLIAFPSPVFTRIVLRVSQDSGSFTLIVPARSWSVIGKLMLVSCNCMFLAVVKFVSKYPIVWPRVIFHTQRTQLKIIFAGPGGNPRSAGGGRCKHE